MLLSWNSLKTASSFPCSRGWLTIWLYLSWSQSASILIHRIINGHTERERTCVAKDSRKCHSYGRPWWVEFPRSRYWKPMRKGRDVRKHFVPELFLSLFTFSWEVTVAWLCFFIVCVNLEQNRSLRRCPWVFSFSLPVYFESWLFWLGSQFVA